MRLAYSRLPGAMLFSLLLLSAVGLGSDAAPDVVSNPEAGARITRLVLRDYEIAISSGASGAARYDVYSQAGEILGTDLTLVQLQASYPGIYDSLRPAVAQEDSDLPIMMMLIESPSFEP